MDRSSLARRTSATPVAAAMPLSERGSPGQVGWRSRLPSRDLLMAWLAAVAAVTVILDFAATF